LGPHMRAIELRNRLIELWLTLRNASQRSRSRWHTPRVLDLLKTLCHLEEWTTDKIVYVVGGTRSFGIQVSDWDALMMSSNALFIDALRGALNQQPDSPSSPQVLALKSVSSR
jgi:hypothetical protein